MRQLHHLLEESARSLPERIAAIEPGNGRVTYRELDRLADRVAGELAARGVGPGDRIGMLMPKSIASLASIFGILKTGAAYVPVDSNAPTERNGFIFRDCGIRFVLARDPDRTGLSVTEDVPRPFEGSPESSRHLAGLAIVPGGLEPAGPRAAAPECLAYILYTSGSTGKPKGVMLTHANALAFVDWCSETFSPSESDCFSSHAPLHFDLSILDIYLCVKHGARLVLIDEESGRMPRRLASIISEERISIWYSTPSILRLLLEIPDLGARDYASLRWVLFAGEVFPIKQLRALTKAWPHPRYCNLYGPTETNVCTWHEVSLPIPPEQTEAVPIGRVCSGDHAMVVDDDHQEVARGTEGELYVAGPSVTSGYWNLPERNAVAFHTDSSGTCWYKTGDIVREATNGEYVYVSRRDRMVKRRGYRVELGEIEATLYRHASITEAAVVSGSDGDGGIRINAFINWNGPDKPSLVALKKFCVTHLPAYMIPDSFSILSVLPKTSTDKIDYQRLKETA